MAERPGAMPGAMIVDDKFLMLESGKFYGGGTGQEEGACDAWLARAIMAPLEYAHTAGQQKMRPSAEHGCVQRHFRQNP